jgi:hypothetical protein
LFIDLVVVAKSIAHPVIARPQRGRGNLLVHGLLPCLVSTDYRRRLPRRFAPRNDTKFFEFCERRTAALSPQRGDKYHFNLPNKLEFEVFCLFKSRRESGGFSYIILQIPSSAAR